MRRLAARLRCTEGQAWTLTLGVALAALLLGLGLPPVLDREFPAQAASAAPPPSSPPAVSTTTVPVVVPAPSTAVAPPTTAGPVVELDDSFALPDGDGFASLPTALRITSAGWATRLPLAGELASTASVIDLTYQLLSLLPFPLPFPLPANPLPDPTVPATGLPVAWSVGAIDKVSFVKLTGSQSVLVLRLIGGGILTQQSVGAAKVLVCPLTSPHWVGKASQPMAAAPPWDCARSVPLVRQADGSYTADLSGFADRAGGAGFALVPTGDVLTSFQLVFASST